METTMERKELRKQFRRYFPELTRKEYRYLSSKNETEIQKMIDTRKAENEEKRRLWEEKDRIERERYAREHEDPLIKMFRGIVNLTNHVSGNDLKKVDGRVVEQNLLPGGSNER